MELSKKSESEYSSPIVLIKKKTNDFRLCVDYRTLNKLTLSDNFPIPLIEDQIDQLRGTAFSSAAFSEFLTNYNITHVMIAVGILRANGQVERFNRVIVLMVAKLTETPDRWNVVLPDVEFALNNTVRGRIEK